MADTAVAEKEQSGGFTQADSRRLTIQQLAFQEMAAACKALTDPKILDVGAGDGEISSNLGAGGAVVTALDLLKPDTIPEGVHDWVAHDLTPGTLPFNDNTFDGLVSTEVIEHLRAPHRILAEMVRVLKPGGVLILTTPNYWNFHYRIRYLLTGNLQRPYIHDEKKRALYKSGGAPHITVMPYPVMKSVLTWEGCEDFALRSNRHYSFGARLSWLPIRILMGISALFGGEKRTKRYLLDETNQPEVLYGRHHILVRCRKSEAG